MQTLSAIAPRTFSHTKADYYKALAIPINGLPICCCALQFRSSAAICAPGRWSVPATLTLAVLWAGPATAITRWSEMNIFWGKVCMASERTFSIIKPDATKRNITGQINAVIENAGLRIIAQKRVLWTAAQAQKFYEEHAARPFYGELVSFMTSGPIVLQVLEGENAIARYREVMGATDPAEAAEGTIRKQFALSKGENSTHGSDSPESAEREIALNFRLDEIVG